MRLHPAFLLLTALTSFPPLLARTYYVAPGGDNTGPGTRAEPWADPGWATRQMSPGDTLILLPGTYVLSEFDADILRPPSGSESGWTVVRGLPGSRPVLAGRDNLLTAIDLSGAHHVLVENLEITHDSSATGEACWFRDGLEALGAPARHLILRNLVIHHVDEFGMNLQDVQDVEISGCRVTYCGFGALGGPAGEQGGWRNVTVRACTLSWSGHYYHGGDGQDRPYERPDGLGTEPSAGPLLIEDTVAEHNYGDGLDSKTARTTIRRCVVANNACDGVKLWADSGRVLNTLIYGRGDGNPQPTPWAALVIDQVQQAGARFEITNVTIDDSLGHNYLLYVQYENTTPVTVAFRNCIFSARGPGSSIYVNGASQLQVDYCLFHFPRTPTLVEHGPLRVTCETLDSLGTGNLCANPLFVHPAWGTEGDYHLLPGSPAVDAGDPAASFNDPDGSRNDLGAYGGPGALPARVSNGQAPPLRLPAVFELIGISPNPGRDRFTVRCRVRRPLVAWVRVSNVLGQTAAGPRPYGLPPGEHELALDLPVLPAGVYVLQIRVGRSTFTRKFCVLR